jgi:hypothetical protein
MATTLLRLGIALIVLTLLFAAGVMAASFVADAVTAYVNGSPPREPPSAPSRFGNAVAPAAGLAGIVVAVRLTAGWYSKRAYPHFSCVACGGGGKDFEPLLLMAMRFGRRRGWRKCPTCDGNPTENR